MELSADHDRRRATLEGEASRHSTKDDEQHRQRVEHGAEDGGRVGRDRSPAVHGGLVPIRSQRQSSTTSRTSSGCRRGARHQSGHTCSRAARRRGRFAAGRDDGAGVGGSSISRTAHLRGTVRLEGARHQPERRTAPLRAADHPLGGGPSCPRHLRGRPVLCASRWPRRSRRRSMQSLVARAARRAAVSHDGVHVLRHTFCSHLAMRGAPARAIQELAGHEA